MRSFRSSFMFRPTKYSQLNIHVSGSWSMFQLGATFDSRPCYFYSADTKVPEHQRQIQEEGECDPLPEDFFDDAQPIVFTEFDNYNGINFILSFELLFINITFYFDFLKRKWHLIVLPVIVWLVLFYFIYSFLTKHKFFQ